MNNNKLDDTVAGFIGGTVVFILFIVFSVYSVAINAFVGAHLWNWFFATTFGLPTITLLQSLGLSLLVSFWTFQHFTYKGKDERDLNQKLGEMGLMLIRPWLMLLFGYIVHSYLQ